MSSNRRRSQTSRTRQQAAAHDALLNGGTTRKRRQAAAPRHSVDDEWQTLNAQIGALENFLTGASARAERQRRQRLQNILPPPDRADLPRDRQRMSRWQERNHYGERQRHGISFFLLFCAVCALLWWLLHTSTAM